MRALPSCLIALALLTACGQKGPLVLPPHRGPAPVTTAAPAPDAAAPASATPMPDKTDDKTTDSQSAPKA